MSKKPDYRPNVAAVIVSSSYPDKKEVFIAQRSDIEGIWQFPQGGIDAGETPEVALLRELEEEIGTNSVKIVAEYPEWISYDFPKKIAKKMTPYKGQTQRYFLVKLNEDAEINLDTEHPEFDKHEFVPYDGLLGRLAHFKQGVYQEVLEYFEKEGLL